MKDGRINVTDHICRNNCIHYGPIRYYRRRGKAPTLLTGRRSKYEQVTGEEHIKRDLRRQRNRFLSKQLKQKRETIERELIQQVKQLQQHQFYLKSEINQLISYKKYLLDKREESESDPLINLITKNDIPLFFQEYHHSINPSIEDFILIYFQ
jgi:hypothetical protein